jgi:hypothetical protein
MERTIAIDYLQQPPAPRTWMCHTEMSSLTTHIDDRSRMVRSLSAGCTL